MHAGAWEDMANMLIRAPLSTRWVLDVGSCDVNGSYRDLVEGRGWRYVGLDVINGKNVNLRTPCYIYPFADATFDVVLNGSTAEHVAEPWLWFPELARILKPGGLLAILTCHHMPEHRFPMDCWRYMKDGLRVLFDATHLLHDYEIEYVSPQFIAGSAIKT